MKKFIIKFLNKKAQMPLCILGFFVSCTKQTNEIPSPKTVEENIAAPNPEEAKLKKGERLYKSLCVSCHHFDPKKSSHIGPDLAGSSLELLTLRLRELKYPEGYKAKRNTQRMQKFTFLKDDDIEALYLYINKP